ncbi:hypothetical protein VTO42DRAFT_8390 [Malbranchea cinnamomea]
MGQLGGLSPQGSIAIGVLVGLISTSLQAIGLTLQRKSHILEDEKHPFDVRRPPYKRKRWQLGMSMFVLSNIVGSTIQITTLPLPVLSTLQASGLVFNTIFATLILGEPFTRYSLIGTVLVCIGAVLIATFGAIGEPAHTLDQLLELLARPAFLKWMAGTGIVVALTLLSIRVVKILATPPRARNLTGRHRVPTTIHLTNPRSKVIRGLLYGSVSGILSAHSLLVAKSAVELLVRTIVDRVNQFNRWQSWVILLGLVAFALTQLYYMHCGLKLCSTSILYPFVFCIYNVIAILDGLIYFHQVSKLSALHGGLVALGTVILLSGVVCLSWRLEEVVGPAVATPSAALTSGLGLLDEERPSNVLYQEDEELQHAGERQPLLLRTSQEIPPAAAQKYTVSRFPSAHRRSLEAAEIWSELADDEEEASPVGDLSVLPPPSPSSPTRRFSRRHRRAVSNPSNITNTTKMDHASSSASDNHDDENSSPLASALNGHDAPSGKSSSSKPPLNKSRYTQLQLRPQRARSPSDELQGEVNSSGDMERNQSAPISQAWDRGRRWVSRWIWNQRADEELNTNNNT